MSLQAQADLSEDNHLMRRVGAQAARLGIMVHPSTTWASPRLWVLAATSGWADLYEAARQREGDFLSAAADPGVITDQMIYDAVHALIAAESPPPDRDPDEPDPAE